MCLRMHRAVGRVHRHGCERGGERERDREAVRVIHRAGGTGEPQVTAGAVSTDRGRVPALRRIMTPEETLGELQSHIHINE